MSHSLEDRQTNEMVNFVRRVNSSARLVRNLGNPRARVARVGTMRWKSGGKHSGEENFQSRDQRDWHATLELNFMVDSGWNYRTVYAPFYSANTNRVFPRIIRIIPSPRLLLLVPVFRFSGILSRVPRLTRTSKHKSVRIFINSRWIAKVLERFVFYKL